MSDTEQQKAENPTSETIGWTQMMSYDEMLKKVRAGAELPGNLQRLEFTADTLPEKLNEFYEEMAKRAQKGPPYCAGTYCGNAEGCSVFTPYFLSRKPCDACQVSVRIWCTSGRQRGSVCPPMKG